MECLDGEQVWGKGICIKVGGYVGVDAEWMDGILGMHLRRPRKKENTEEMKNMKLTMDGGWSSFYIFSIDDGLSLRIVWRC